ncbi:uncharacterized protein LACBIDRAFT_299466 [Laccaria bicolor S238N-H82]|uniref:Predicted protein n=1 Tax=Laccaria bicolor (strain S238N-H82 / ATCC MYA-4686) TaxID=486041 RepID=B0DES0_LACBS|nr:uncharacterized protein LACBIDRAFT_299466 [Laccaria bicolor S238N-H82]EDR06989.1 predicted protein [Laccaria bicolor S238N-H82]|eukprot:XP_001882362.1 predicted protein [Laccaria bicolor S238N-H82]
MVTLTDDGARDSSPLPASLAIDELFARLDIGPRSARTILRALLRTVYSDIPTPVPVPDFHGDAWEVLGFGASDPNYTHTSDDEDILVFDPTISPNASATTLCPTSPADPGNGVLSIAIDSASATAARVVPLATAPTASTTALTPADVLAPVGLRVLVATPAAPVVSLTPTTANNVTSTAGPASAATPDAASTTAPAVAIMAPTGALTTSTAALYAPNYVLPYNAPKNAILPPPSLVTPIYGYHVPGLNESGPFYMASRGRNIGIFSGWEILSPFVTGVSHSAYSKVSSIQEGHTRMAAAINAGFALYLT